MEVNLQVKIKLKEGKEIVLDKIEAKELFAKLKDIFIIGDYTPYYPIYSNNPPITYKDIPTWTSGYAVTETFTNNEKGV